MNEMDPTIVARVLADFEITQVANSAGKPSWTLEVSDTAGQNTHTVQFDEVSSKWLLKSPSRVVEYATSQSSITSLSVTASDVASPVLDIESDVWANALPTSEHTHFFRTTDWAASPLGPLATWPHALRLYTHKVFCDNRPAALYWGRTCLYNEHHVPLLGGLHPHLMSRSLETVSPQVWPMFEPIFLTVEENCTSYTQTALDLPFRRNGYLEETWWDGSIVALRDDTGKYGGCYFQYVDITRQVLSDRYAEIFTRLSQSSLASSQTMWKHTHDVFTDFARDIPMAVLYGVEESVEEDQRLHLRYKVGLSDEYTAAPNQIELDVKNNDAVLAPLFRQAAKSTSGWIGIDLFENPVHPSIVANIDWRGHGEPSTHLVAIAVRSGNISKGFALLALNPRRPFDPDHKQFVTNLTRRLSELATRITTKEEALKREQVLLSQLTEQERRINTIAQVAPVGIYDLDANGTMLWASDHFFEILGADNRDVSTFSWQDYLRQEDHERAYEEINRCIAEKIDITVITVRLNRTWCPPSTEQGSVPEAEPVWIIYSATPRLREDGSVGSMMGCATDITKLKWAEETQARSAEVSMKAREAQENFIDMTSHEMRNPLSAITQCADSIINSPQDITGGADIASLLGIIKLNVEAAESILFCATHQRRIIDDVLTLGKLHSNLLTITPIAFRPQSLVEDALQMFKAEVQSGTIEVVSISDERAGLMVHGDPYRLMQILVNLLTNAIKFTRTEKTRKITIHHGSSYSEPSNETFGHDFRWFPSKKTRHDLTRESGYGEGRPVYLYYSVVDTGKGIPGKFMDTLFSKFEQADKKTHIKYGGSGLGLFISRELTEMQGGYIGSASTEGIGSTFAFYTKARCARAEENDGQLPRDSVSQAARNIYEVVPESRKNQGITNGIPTPPKSGKYNILLAEDNLVNQKVLAKQLRKLGCTVHIANHGGEAIDFFLKSLVDVELQVDCILMDWEMPICDGVTATMKIREIETQQKVAPIAIIGTTANARPEQILKATDAGMNMVVTKPFRVPELLTKIDECLRRRHGSPNGT